MTGSNPAAPPPDPAHRRRRIYLVIAFLIGVVVGIIICYSISVWNLPSGPPGDCVHPDGSVYMRGVTQAYCRRVCPSCTWVQN